MSEARYLEAAVAADLDRRMVFLAGPRQVGKTTLAKQILASSPDGAYFDWDNRDDRREIRAARWPGGDALVVLDELHKWKGWKGWIKGEYDKHRDHVRFLVTGSARLDVYRKGADSLQGRYHHYRLHPFSCAEVGNRSLDLELEPGAEIPIPTRAAEGDLRALLEFGGFPEPLLAGSPRTLRRWQKERLDRFFREDVRDLESVRNLGSLELAAEMVGERVGSPLSLNAIREDLEVSHRAVSTWMDVLERLYHLYRVRPFAARQVRALKRMPKAFLWDWSLVPDPAARLENLVASHLLKLCHVLEDRDGWRTALTYLRDRTGREVDFLVTVAGKPWFAVEVKRAETRIDPSLVYFRDRLRIPWAYQAVLESSRDFVEQGIRCLPVAKLLAALA